MKKKNLNTSGHCRFVYVHKLKNISNDLQNLLPFPSALSKFYKHLIAVKQLDN